MNTVSVTIRGFVDDSFPGFVEFVLVDADGHEHHFVEKVPVVGGPANLSFDTVFPQRGHIDCVVLDEWFDDQGRGLIHICTLEPWDIESVAGETNFTLLRDQIVGN